MNRLIFTLNAHRTTTQSWQISETQSLNDEIVNRKGVLVKEGWAFEWKNGIADFYPFRNCYDLTAKGDVERFGLAALRLRKTLRQKHRGYAAEGRKWLRTLGTRIAAPFLAILALIVTLVTFPLYLIAFALWLVIAIFWMIFAYMASLVARKALSKTISQN